MISDFSFYFHFSMFIIFWSELRDLRFAYCWITLQLCVAVLLCNNWLCSSRWLRYYMYIYHQRLFCIGHWCAQYESLAMPMTYPANSQNITCNLCDNSTLSPRGLPRLNSLGYGVTYLLVSRKTKALHSSIPKFNLLYFSISCWMVLVWYLVFSQAFW